ncbi:hypothetical protein [Cognatilysobacter lacus]|uniref:Uncharacterized protein n=1 Tax=Cognatilysobacter lacus TaxID=1643323 RepID=A0A5D8Z3Z2_9GAMM|nr:hypothetical protein [Lysobacter lacus]TZF87424.1 hypothetical protein FW784_11150 [Lysobacter lacus]
MNDEHIPLDEDRALPDTLRWQLRAQRENIAPPAHLWDGIEARLGAQPVSRHSTLPRYAIAASVLLAAVAGGLLLQARSPVASSALARREAQSLTREYDRAIGSMPEARAPAELAPALVELDRSAGQIRRALQNDPDSRLLLDQLRRTYSLRLALSQRAIVG